MSLLVVKSLDLPSILFISYHVCSDKVSQQPIQGKMGASVPMANFHMTSTNTVTPFSISMQQHPNQQSQVPKEG
jgi:hypothetical protein